MLIIRGILVAAESYSGERYSGASTMTKVRCHCPGLTARAIQIGKGCPTSIPESASRRSPTSPTGRPASSVITCPGSIPARCATPPGVTRRTTTPAKSACSRSASSPASVSPTMPSRPGDSVGTGSGGGAASASGAASRKSRWPSTTSTESATPSLRMSTVEVSSGRASATANCRSVLF